ncbi:hypothetical protein KKB55_22530, partial [Myxococcota bacterium]|nr:hypothetical protein [Myxococcota bacterium]
MPLRAPPLALLLGLLACSDPPRDALSTEAGLGQQTPQRDAASAPPRVYDALIHDAAPLILDWGLPPDIGGGGNPPPPVDAWRPPPPIDAGSPPVDAWRPPP